MNKYKEQYNLLEEKILSLKQKKNNLETELRVKKYKEKEIENKYFYYTAQISKITMQRNNMISSKKELIVTATMILSFLVLVAAICVGVNTVTEVSSVIGKVFAGLGLFIGLGGTHLMITAVLISISDLIRKKIENKTKKKSKYISLTNKIQTQNKQIEDIKKQLEEVKKEKNKISEDISCQQELIEKTIKEFEKLKVQIVSELIETPEETINKTFMSEPTKPYIRVKTKNN